MNTYKNIKNKITYEQSYCFKKWKTGKLEIDAEFIESVKINGQVYGIEHIKEEYDDGYATIPWIEPYVLVDVDDIIFKKRLSEIIDEGKEVELNECL